LPANLLGALDERRPEALAIGLRQGGEPDRAGHGALDGQEETNRSLGRRAARTRFRPVGFAVDRGSWRDRVGRDRSAKWV
jgi:hypothetical protein